MAENGTTNATRARRKCEKKKTGREWTSLQMASIAMDAERKRLMANNGASDCLRLSDAMEMEVSVCVCVCAGDFCVKLK